MSISMRRFRPTPIIEFYLLAMESGRLEFLWEEDGGSIYRLEHQLAVA